MQMIYENNEKNTFNNQFYSPFHFQGYNENISPPMERSFPLTIKCKNCNQSVDKNLEKERRASSKAIFKSHCIKFCETTSLRGVPRIIKSSNPKQRLLWTFFVLVFFIACVTCVGLLVSQYRAYDVIHQPRTVYNQSRPFPSLTVCNLRPLTSRGIQIVLNNNILTAREYLSKIKVEMKELRGYLNKIQTKLVTTSWNLNTYFLNLPKSINLNDLGHSRHNMVLSCAVVYREGIYTSVVQCEKAGKWVSTVSKIFHNCHTFTVSEAYTNMTFNLEMVLYLDNFDDTECPDCQPLQIATQLTGAHLNLHSEGTYPQIEVEGLNLLPGTLTEIRFTPREWSMMEPPHGKCSKNVNMTMSFDNEVFKYSESSCKQQLLQEELIKQCDCIDFHQVPTELMWAKEQLKICKFLRFPVERNNTDFKLTVDILHKFMAYTECELKTASSLQYILEKCKSPCTYFTYDTSISSAKWPAKSFHTAFAKYMEDKIKRKHSDLPIQKDPNEVIEPLKDLHRKLSPYKRVTDLRRRNRIVEANELLGNLTFIEQNLLAVQVARPNFDITLVEEKAVVSLTSFLSQTGGLLSIWSGITFFCIVELFEMFILICDSLFVKAKATKHSEEC